MLRPRSLQRCMGTSYQAAHSTASRVISDALLAVQSAASSSMMVNSHAIRPMSTRFVYQTYVPEETEVYHPCFAKGYIYTPKFSYSAARFPAIRAARQCLGGPAASETMTCGQISGRALNQGEDAGDERLMQCQQLIMRIFNKDAPCLVAQCPLVCLLLRLKSERLPWPVAC